MGSKMTRAAVRARVAIIIASAGDNESAHADEDELWHDVLEAIAAGAPNPAELATEALKTAAVDFDRWYA